MNPTTTTSTTNGVVDARSIQAQFATLTTERDRYHQEKSQAEINLAREQQQISLQRSRQSILVQQIQTQSAVLGTSDRSFRLLKDREGRLRRQHADESKEIVMLTNKIDSLERQDVESKRSYFVLIDGLNDELDRTMNRYEEKRFVGLLTVDGVRGVVLPKLRVMAEAERMLVGGGDGTGGGEVGGDGDTPDPTDPSSPKDVAANFTNPENTKAKEFTDLSDRIASSLALLKDAQMRLESNRRAKADAEANIGTLRGKMMQGSNRDGRLFSELDLTELEDKWEAEYRNSNMDYDDDEEGEEGRGTGEGGSGGGNKDPTGASNSTASMDLFYSAASDEQGMMTEDEFGTGGGAADGKVFDDMDVGMGNGNPAATADGFMMMQ